MAEPGDDAPSESVVDDIQPRDSVSQVCSHTSSKSTHIRIATKRAGLKARQDALRKLQEIRLEEFRCKQKREEVELQVDLAEAEAEQQAYDELVSNSGSRSCQEDSSTKPASPEESNKKAGLNPAAKEWTPVSEQQDDEIVFRMDRQPAEAVVNCQPPVSSQQQLLKALQLPNVEVMTFDGNPLNYWAFMRSFESSIEKHCISEDVKLMRLVQCTTGKARQVIRCCCVMDSQTGFKRAKELLKERFGNDYVITESWIKKVGSFGSIKPAEREKLREFSDELNSCKETLKAMGRLSEINNQTNLLKIVEKLPMYLQNSWRKEARDIRVRKKETPGIEQLTEFVQRAAEIANDPVFGTSASQEQMSRSTRHYSEPYSGTRRNAHINLSGASKPKTQCPKCQADHQLFACEAFKRMKPEERLQFVRSKRLCDNCLRYGHKAAQCLKPTRCTVTGCGKRHTRFLHIPVVHAGNNSVVQPSDQFAEQQSSRDNADRPAEVQCGVTGAGVGPRVSLPIVPVKVKVKGSSYSIKACALLDSGSTNTFCSEELADQLGVKGQKETFTLTTLGRADSVEEASVINLEVSDIQEEMHFDLPKVYTRRELPIGMQNVAASDDVMSWPHLHDIPLPDVEGLKVMLLIGQDVPEAMICYETCQGPKGAPYAVKTPFGWTVNGPLNASGDLRAYSSFISADMKLDRQVERFWKMECSEMIACDETAMSVSDSKAVSVWNDTISFKDGHYEVAIPFKDRPPSLPDNRQMAEERLESLRRRLERDSVLKAKYQAGISDLVAKGYAEKVPDEEVSRSSVVWYLPHHPVFHPKKPDKVRIVFDCAARYAGRSLNDQVLQGPDLTNRLVGVLLRFRQESVALTADIESMFHQVRVVPEDREVLRFLWWNSGNIDTDPDVFRMKVHIFGGVWSPSCCNYVLRRTADDNESDFSQEAVDSVRRNFYVDDCLRSVASTSEAVRLVKELRELVSRGGFRLTKWLSNDRSVLQSIPAEEVVEEARYLDLDSDVECLPTERVLGVLWNSESDTFGYGISVPERRTTRRGILSVVSSVYDPLGFICPFILPAKKMIQELCRRSVGWDENLPEDILTAWISWLKDVPKLNQLSLPRCMKPQCLADVECVQLHHFSDASVEAYGTVSYIRVIDKHGNIHCSILMAKSKLAPMKQISIPRLELSAAVLAVRIDQCLRRELDVAVAESLFWSDSTAVLRYIKNENKRFHTFVANRLAVIHSGSLVSQWHHVSTRVNPADHASRGMTADQLVSSYQWFNGPDFLWQAQKDWPSELDIDACISVEDEEVKKSAQVYLTAPESSEVQKNIDLGVRLSKSYQADSSDIITRLFERRSSWYALKKDVAHLLRVKCYLRNKCKKLLLPDMVKSLTVTELREAELQILRCVQAMKFPAETTAGCAAGKASVTISKSSPLYRLEPVMFEDGLLHIGGRLQTHPVILPSKDHVTTLIIRHFHAESGHSGKEHTLALIREQFWIVNARRCVRRELMNCPVCKLRDVKPTSQRMAALPADRITPGDPPFSCVGVDVFGPFMVKRGRSVLKRYGCLFTCMKIRAVHIEVLHTLETDSFINALQRFICRRGRVKELRSDNGTNFVGADRELRTAISDWNAGKIDNFLRQKAIQWRFNPPAASHMGGVWERQIRTVRRVLSSVMKEQTVDDEALTTMFCLVESIVNSRPLTAVSDDHKDPKPLSPNDLLLLGHDPLLPPGDFVKQDLYCKRRWRQIQYLADVFWRRWTREYLPTLQLRQKWLNPVRNIAIGDIVIISDDNSPRNTWRLGRIVETYPSTSDGLVRTVKVSTKSGSFVRPVHKICLLESTEQSIDSDEPSDV